MEGSALLALSWVCSCCLFVVGQVEEFIDLDHIARHIVGPFEDLRPNVIKEGIGGPATHNHDLVRGMVH